MVLAALLAFLQLALPPTEDRALPEEGAARQEAEAHFGRMERLLPLAVEMGRLQALDQYSRRSLTSAFSELKTEADFKAYTGAVADHLDEVDRIVTAGLKDLLRRSSWREFAEAPKFLLEPALHILKHTADQDFQQAALADLRVLASEGMVPSQEIASLIDSTEMSAGRMQVFGSRLQCMEGERVAIDLLDPDQVDERRAEMGLGPLRDHIAEIDANVPPCPQG